MGILPKEKKYKWKEGMGVKIKTIACELSLHIVNLSGKSMIDNKKDKTGDDDYRLGESLER